MTIGEKIKYLREKNNMTQTDVAKQIGIATQTIFKYEKNIVTNIPLDNIEKLAKIFDVTPAYMMGWEDNDPYNNLSSEEAREMSNLQTRLRELRKENKLTQSDMAKLLREKYNLKTDRVMISKWETGFQTPEVYTITCIADLFGVTMDYLNGKEKRSIRHNDIYKSLPEPNITEDYTTFPVIGEVAAGYECVAVEDWEGDIVDIPLSYLHGRNKSDFFVLRVKGDSMYPQYQDGDKVLVLKQSTMDYSGQIGVVIYGDDKGTLKKIEYAQGEDWMRLIPINPSFPPTEITNENLEHCRVLGIPKFVLREVNQSVITKSDSISFKNSDRVYTSAKFDDNEERIAAFGGIKEDDDTTYTS